LSWRASSRASMVGSSISSKNTWMKRSPSSSELSAPPQRYSVAGSAAWISSSRRAGSHSQLCRESRRSPAVPALLAPRRRQSQRTAQGTGPRHRCMPGPAGKHSGDRGLPGASTAGDQHCAHRYLSSANPEGGATSLRSHAGDGWPDVNRRGHPKDIHPIWPGSR
jgi:hypothetical protein